jgi:RNA polymerase sigma-B factor
MTQRLNVSARRSDTYEHCAPLLRELSDLPVDDPRRKKLRDDILTEFLPLAEHIALRYARRGETHDDLVQVARIGLIHAVDRFEPARGSDFLSFAVPTIMGEIRRYFRDTGWAVRVPRRLKELHLSLNQGSNELSQNLGRAPTPSELARHLGLDVEQVREGLIARNAYTTTSMDHPVVRSSEVLTLADTLGEDDKDLLGVEEHEALRPMLQNLPERERSILLLRFFGGMTQTQIAQRMNMSQMHVSRLLSQTLEQLRNSVTDGLR